jgi:hypothetical protein
VYTREDYNGSANTWKGGIEFAGNLSQGIHKNWLSLRTRRLADCTSSAQPGEAILWQTRRLLRSQKPLPRNDLSLDVLRLARQLPLIEKVRLIEEMASQIQREISRERREGVQLPRR